MKKILSFLVVLVLMAAPAIAHPGGTDGKGGHTDRSTGVYHYHHGYEAHQHEDGVCPYDFDDKTGEGSGSSGGSRYSSYSTLSNDYWYNEWQKENDEKIALQRELKKIEENRLRNFVVPMGVGLAVGLASLILQAIRHAKKMEFEIEQLKLRLNNEAARAQRALMGEWESKLKTESAKYQCTVLEYARLLSKHITLIEDKRDKQLFLLKNARQHFKESEAATGPEKKEWLRQQGEMEYKSALNVVVEPDLSQGVVYIPKNLAGEECHTTQECGPWKKMLVSRKTAYLLGYDDCQCCTFNDDPVFDLPVIAAKRNAKLYHSPDSYCLMSEYDTMTLTEALKKNLKPCTRCIAPTENPKVWF